MKWICAGLVAATIAIACIARSVGTAPLGASRIELAQAISGDDRPAEKLFASVSQVDWSLDGRRLLALARGDVGSAGPLVLFDLGGSENAVSIQGGGGTLSAVALAPDGRHVLAASWEGRLSWIGIDSAERSILAELPAPVEFLAVAVSRRGALAAAATSEGMIYVGRTKGPFAPRLLDGHRGGVQCLRFSEDEGRIVSAGQDGQVRIWDIASGQCVRRLLGHSSAATRAVFVEDGRSVLSTGLDGTLRLWDVEQGIEIWQAESDGEVPWATLAVSTMGTIAAARGLSDAPIVVWDLKTRQQTLLIDGHPTGTRDLKFSPDGNSLASGGLDGMIRIWDAHSGASKAVISMAHGP